MTGKISNKISDVDQDFQHARSALFVRVGSDRKENITWIDGMDTCSLAHYIVTDTALLTLLICLYPPDSHHVKLCVYWQKGQCGQKLCSP